VRSLHFGRADARRANGLHNLHEYGQLRRASGAPRSHAPLRAQSAQRSSASKHVSLDGRGGGGARRTAAAAPSVRAGWTQSSQLSGHSKPIVSALRVHSPPRAHAAHAVCASTQSTLAGGVACRNPHASQLRAHSAASRPSLAHARGAARSAHHAASLSSQSTALAPPPAPPPQNPQARGQIWCMESRESSQRPAAANSAQFSCESTQPSAGCSAARGGGGGDSAWWTVCSTSVLPM